MVFFRKKQRGSFLSCVIILLTVCFFLGEAVGLYASSHTKADLNAVINTFHFDQAHVGTVRKTLCFYFPCLLSLIHYRWFMVVPAVLFCRGYFFTCSLAAISYMNTDDMFNLFGVIFSVVIHTMSLTVLASSLFSYQLIKQKYIFGNVATDRKNVFNAVIFALFSILICCISELFIYH